MFSYPLTPACSECTLFPSRRRRERAFWPLSSFLSVVEIGTRNGDGVACWAHFAKTVTAVEMDKRYCQRLRERQSAAGAAAFDVVCSPFPSGWSAHSAWSQTDVFTWWVGGDGNKKLLKQLTNSSSRFAAHAEAVILFDTRYNIDLLSWNALRPWAKWTRSAQIRLHRAYMYSVAATHLELAPRAHTDTLTRL